MNGSSFILLMVVLVVLLELTRRTSLWKWLTRPTTPSPARKPWMMKPKSEKDCPRCRENLADGQSLGIACAHQPIPWNQKKGKGGRKKSLSRQNYFCANPECDYYLITEARVHVLVGYGWHGKNEDIQDLRCQACRKKFTVRRHTVLYRLKTHPKIIRLALNLLALGVDVSALEAVLEIRESTLRTWLTAQRGAQAEIA